MHQSFNSPEDDARLKVNLEDDVRSFLLSRLPWNRMSPAERRHWQSQGIDAKVMRRPAYINVTPTAEAGPPEAVQTKCHLGAEGVMTHKGEDCVHLAFKCGNPRHKYHYSTFSVGTVIAMAKACEAAWPGTISHAILEQALSNQGLPFPPPVLDPGEDDVDLDESSEEELEFLDELEDDEDDDIVI